MLLGPGKKCSRRSGRLWDVLWQGRLAHCMEEILPVMKRCKELELDEPVMNNLLSVSAATIDRMMAPGLEQTRALRNEA